MDLNPWSPATPGPQSSKLSFVFSFASFFPHPSQNPAEASLNLSPNSVPTVSSRWFPYYFTERAKTEGRKEPFPPPHLETHRPSHLCFFPSGSVEDVSLLLSRQCRPSSSTSHGACFLQTYSFIFLSSLLYVQLLPPTYSFPQQLNRLKSLK